MRQVYLVTDCVDVAAAEIQATIAARAKSDFQFTLAPVQPFSLENCWFIVRLIAEVAPEGSIILIVIGPKKHKDEIVVGKTSTKNLFFISPNSGVTGWLIRDFGCLKVAEIEKLGYRPFGGRNYLAPIAAAIINGWDFQLGQIENTLIKPNFPITRLNTLNIEDGTTVHIDNFGLIKFTGSVPKGEEGDRYKISVNNMTITAVYSSRMMSMDTGTWVIYPGSSLDLWETGQVRMNGAISLQVMVGDKLEVKKL